MLTEGKLHHILLQTQFQCRVMKTVGWIMEMIETVSKQVSLYYSYHISFVYLLTDSRNLQVLEKYAPTMH